MPVVHGRLTCCTCGADLGDAEDPYLDPCCVACERRQDFEDDDPRAGLPLEQPYECQPTDDSTRV